MAIFGSFGAHRGPKMACSNLFRPKITFPHILIVIFSKKKEFFFFNLTTLFGSVAHSVNIRCFVVLGYPTGGGQVGVLGPLPLSDRGAAQGHRVISTSLSISDHFSVSSLARLRDIS